MSTLIAELKQLQNIALGENNKMVVSKLNDSYTLTILKKGLNEKYKQTILTGQPKTFLEAKNIALEIENSFVNSNSTIRVKTKVREIIIKVIIIMIINTKNTTIKRYSQKKSPTGYKKKYVQELS